MDDWYLSGSVWTLDIKKTKVMWRSMSILAEAPSGTSAIDLASRAEKVSDFLLRSSDSCCENFTKQWGELFDPNQTIS